MLTAIVFILFYSVLEDTIATCQQPISMSYFTKIYFSTLSAANVFLLLYSTHKDRLGLLCYTSRDLPHLTGFAILKVQQDVREFRDNRRFKAKCELHR